MTAHARWTIVGTCVALATAAITVVAWRECGRRNAAAAADAARREAEAAIASRAKLYRQFDIDADGARLFVPLPSVLTHHLGRAKIGQRLFNDPRLACSRYLVCGVCHQLGAGGTDSKIHHGVLTRPVYNTTFATSFLHDGSLPDVRDAICKMIEDPRCAGGGPLAKVVARLEKDEALVKLFNAAYEGTGLTDTNVVDSVAEYMKTLVTSGTPFDFWCAGDTGRLTSEQQRGSEVFLSASCMDCHDGPVLGSRKVSNGRKVPALRGLGLRKAYLTDGKRRDLDAVVQFMPGGKLPPGERKALVSFLRAL